MFLLVLFFAPKKRTDWGVGVSPTNGTGDYEKTFFGSFFEERIMCGGIPHA